MKSLTALMMALALTAGCAKATTGQQPAPAAPVQTSQPGAPQIPDLDSVKKLVADGAGPGAFYVQNLSKKYDIRLLSDLGAEMKASKNGGQDVRVTGYGYDRVWRRQFNIETDTPNAGATVCMPRVGTALCGTTRNICVDCALNANTDCWYVRVTDAPCRK